jgi:uncharacterized protein DUF5691
VSGLSFDDLVAVAALGVSRKGFAAAELDGPAAGYAGVLDAADPAAALLDAAALLTVADRAGVVPPRRPGALPPSGVLPPRATGGDGHAEPTNGSTSERELSARGTRLLARLGGLGRQRGTVVKGTAVKGTELLGDLLTAMRDAGYVLPAPLLPDLLDIASRTAALRPLVASVLGRRGVWLAGHRTDWQAVAGASPHEERGPAGWRVGRPAERLAYLAGLRERDPAAARELLAAGWSQESRAERAELLAALGHGLSADDEEFLESALDDRAKDVREAAMRLLALLPGSAFRRRTAERAAAVLRLEGDGPGARLVARVPADLDRAAVRDGIEARTPGLWVDDSAWRLSQLIAGAPLADWTARFGLTPTQITALPVEGAAAIEVRAGWRFAAARQSAGRQDTGGQNRGGTDPELSDWALALLEADFGLVNGPGSVWVPDAVLAGLLSADLRAARAAALLTKAGSDTGQRAYAARAELASHPVPWPAVLADAVLRVMRSEILRPKLTVLSQAVVDTAGRGMPATGEKDYAAELTRLANSMPQSWLPEVMAAAETIALRRAFLEELQ